MRAFQGKQPHLWGEDTGGHGSEFVAMTPRSDVGYNIIIRLNVVEGHMWVAVGEKG